MSAPLSSDPSPPALAVDYYRTNFLTLIHTVQAQYDDLLTPDEREWLITFLALPLNSQCLYLRLLTRKGPLFRLYKLDYDEIPDRDVAAQHLADAGFIHFALTDFPLAQICALFTKPELLQRFSCLHALKQATKPRLVERLSEHPITFTDFHEPLFAICHSEHLQVFLLLFFGNSHQDLSQFVLAELGRQTFEQYPLDRQHRFFHERQHIEDWLSLSQLNDAYWQAKTQRDTDAICALVPRLPPAFTWVPLENKRQTLINHLARDLERHAGDCPMLQQQALSLFRQSQRPPSRERQVRLLEKQHQLTSALTLTKDMLSPPFHEDETDVAHILFKRLAKKKGESIPACRPFSPNEIHLKLTAQSARVETCVADYFQQHNWEAHYVENHLMCGLFGLAFWDIIYTPIAGAFLNPYQRSPRDMFTPEFYLRRKQAINHRLHAIEHAQWNEWLTVYQKKGGIGNDWVHWSALNEELIKRSIEIIPTHALRMIFERMVFDPKNNRSGFPDLILFNKQQYCWVEVKGPGDTLQRNQMRWLSHFEQYGIPAKVAYVTWV
ncbi:VRR-NUC domain-containing protein [Photobacterium japonica]|uniref:VRR-NUC domain-containing protein n=1 Tax=Photobacterium japonica TaxID=2910235 RepID=UPI003D151545